MRLRGWITLVAVLPTTAADGVAQPTLDSLWPNADGLRWNFDFVYSEILYGDVYRGILFASPASMQFAGSVETAGGTAQMLVAAHAPLPEKPQFPGSDPSLRALWRARPDLRARIAARTQSGPTTEWTPILLQNGPFLEQPTAIEMWQPGFDHATWTYLRDPIEMGATFTMQLLPEIVDHVFLHVTIEAIDATVVTTAGTFENAVRVRYRVDYGWEEDPIFEPGSLYRSETRGHVHYVPGTGPVDMREEFVPYVEIDCGANPCPQAWRDLLAVTAITQTLSLRDTNVAVAPRTWSEVKNLYH